ncbi:Retrovirus-related Pol polyprotein from transposon TNT 1-94 [Cucumis melo var. makuwa]|uniref:Retrovirus-related Pol polyprotein from transposon TNT 1-94 n=1 Tax=Cucumis melo var. makuwa TaxID=1194695 RepID=A0A5D3DX90_CUCMM|nr:Retrovirus-related Pol polyprotein from transposon TNT 1-94 [Cucumis melo var. makuwa]
MIRVIRRNRSQLDCLSVSFGYTTDQFVLGVPSGSPKTSFVPTGSQIVRVRERASSWVLLCRTLMGSEGKGRGKLASNREGSVTCHMGTQFCFRVYGGKETEARPSMNKGSTPKERGCAIFVGTLRYSKAGISLAQIQARSDSSFVFLLSRYDELGEQRLEPFAKDQEECGIVPQYTMLGKPKSLLGEALKTATYILNRVPSKAVAKTPYKLWTGKKPSIMHLHIWGCPVEDRTYRPNERKLDPRTISCYFVRHSKHSRSLKFYDPTSKSFFETGNAKFLENVEFEGEDNIKKVVFEEELVSLPNVGIDDIHTLIPDFTMEPIMQQDDNEVPKVQTQQSQEVPLRRSTREK